MAPSLDIASYSDALVVLGTAAVIVPLVRRAGISPVLGYLAAGAALGPLGLGSFLKSVPALYWFTIVDASHVAGIAELGIVFLLFMIGLELSFQRLKAMRRLVVGMGGLQVIVTSVVIAGIASLAGIESTAAIVLGATVSLSCPPPPSCSSCCRTKAGCRPRSAAPASPSSWRRTSPSFPS